jgi:prepilin-type N-terminal cleavage/methylation domain-containing protein
MKRRGFTLIEIAVAMVVLAVLTTLCLNFFAAVNGRQKEQRAELAATQEAASAMERLAATAWDDLAKKNSEQFALSPQARKALPEGRMDVKIGEAVGTPPARRIGVTVFWRPQLGEPERKAQLIAWRYKLP